MNTSHSSAHDISQLDSPAGRSSFQCLVPLLAAFVLSAQSVTADSYDTLRDKWKTMLNGGTNYNTSDPDIAARISSITSTANSYWSSMVKTGGNGRAYLWSNLASTTDSSAISGNFSRLKAMGLAYATKGSSLENNATLRTDIIGGLDWMYANRYNETKTEYDNWWDWEIGGPLAFNDATVFVYGGLSGTQITNYVNAVDHFTPAPAMTGANRVWKCTVVAVRGIIGKSSSKITSARDGLSPVLPYTWGDGFHTDGSFIQHTAFPYVGGYGLALLQDLPNLVYLLQGSTWPLTDPNQTNMFRWIYDAYAPFIYKGAFMSMVRGREVARSSSQDHARGHSAMQYMLRWAQLAAAADSLAYKRMIKYWMQQDTYSSFIPTIGNIDLLLLGQAVRDDASILPMNEPVQNKPFPEMDRVVHLRPGFGFGLSMFSTRIFNYESINGENLKGWHTADGMTYLYNGDLGQYDDNYWPTVNKYRLAGTTVDTQTLANGANEASRSTQNWVGAAEIQGIYGVAGQSLDSVASSLVAKKSWFMFDDEIVALGSGITSTDNRTIETIVENRRITGANALTVNGTAQATNLGWSATLSSVNWIHLAGTSSSSDIGYYFPTASTVKGLREARTSSWSDIGTGSTNLSTRNYLTLWRDHGANPSAATYAYVLLPNKTAAQVSSYAASPNITILENSTSAQAVKENTLNIVAVNFWQDVSKTVDILTSDRKASVIARENTGVDIEISASDPTQTNSTINLEIARAASGVISQDSRVTVNQLSPTIKLAINVSCGATNSNTGNGIRGHAWKAKFSLTAADTTPPSVSLTAPAAGAFVRGTAVTVSANASDNVGVVGVQFKLDGANLGAEDTSSPYSITWNTTTAANGSHTLTAVARDAAGNSTTSAGVTVTVDNAVPTVSVTAPANGAFVKGTTVTVSANASDNIGVVGVQFKLDGADLGAEDTSSPYSITWNTTTASDGGHTLTAVARDAAGNTTTSSSVSVTVDNAAPTVSITAPPFGPKVSGPAVTVSASAADNIGVVGVQFKLDGANLGAEDTSSPYGVTWNTLSSTDGSHTLTAVARDAAGNTTTSAGLAVIVSNICYTAQAAGGWVNVAVDSQAANFTAEFDSTPSVSAINSVIGLSFGGALDYTNLAAIVRFNPTNNIDARNGGAYTAASTIPYSPNQNYHFRLVVNVPGHTYSAYVTPAGGSEQTIGLNYAFRTEQSGVSILNNLGVYVGATNGANEVCNITAVDAALKAWLKLDETAGVLAVDSSKNGNNGTLVNGPVWTTGGIGGALDFDGVDDYVTLVGSATLTNLTQFTYAAWIYPVTAGENNFGRIFSRESGTGLDEFYFNVQSTNNLLGANVANSAGTNSTTISTSQMTFNAWQHVAVTYNDAGDRKLHIFLNGVEVSYSAQPAVTGTLKVTINALNVGNRMASDRTFDGAIDDARVYNRVLTQAEILALP
jgi:hyaluronate lyase